MKKFLLTTLLLFPLIVYSGWFKSYTGTHYDRGYCLIQDNDAIFVAGQISYTSYYFANKDFCLLKTNLNGDSIWLKRYGYSIKHCHEWATDMSRTSDQGFILIGNYHYFTDHDIFLVRLDSVGDSLWFSILGGCHQDEANSGFQTNDGGFIICGWTRSWGAGEDDVFVIKTDSMGNIIWQRTYGDSANNEGCCIQETFDCNYIIAGRTGNWPDPDVYLIKIDSIGDTLWTRTIHEKYYQGASYIIQNADSGFTIAGTSNLILSSGYDVYVIRTDKQGFLKWSNLYGGPFDEEAACIQPTLDGGFIITGTTNSFGSNGDNIYLLKIDSMGRFQWDRAFDHSSFNERNRGWHDAGSYVEQTPDRGYIVTGYVDSDKYDEGNIFLLKTDSLGVAVEENIITIPSQNSFSINYLDNLRTAISFSLTQAGQVSVDVYDLSGRGVSSLVEGYYPAGEHCIYWQAPLPGVYFFRIRSDQLDKTEKTAVLR